MLLQNKNHLLVPFITEWHINLHKMLSLINASRKMSGSALTPKKGRPLTVSTDVIPLAYANMDETRSDTHALAH
jgi:hypothetical protein